MTIKTMNYEHKPRLKYFELYCLLVYKTKNLDFTQK